MDKRRLTKILVRADRNDVLELSADILKTYQPVIVKEPAKTLTMIRLRDPVKEGNFYIGEVIACEAAVEINGVQGFSVMMGDDTEKTLAIAILDAAINMGVFGNTARLVALEKEQNKRIMQEHAMTLNTMVHFESMDQEAPDDLAANKKE